MNVTFSGPRQAAPDVFGTLREMFADLADLVGEAGTYQYVRHGYGEL